MAVDTRQRHWDGTIYVAGEFRPPGSGATAPVLEKATGEPLAHAAVATADDLDAAVAAAAAGRSECAATGYPY